MLLKVNLIFWKPQIADLKIINFIAGNIHAGKKLADSIVREKLAACVNIVPGMSIILLLHAVYCVPF